MPPAGGELLAHYRLIEKIGEGGMGVVYKAWDTRLERTLALKLLKHDILRHDESRARLLREARLASSLNHPYIATIYDLEQVDGRDIIAMEFVSGRTLRERMREAPMELRDVLDITVAIADALSEAHASNVVHRDIKPDNIILTPRGHPKVMDFGLAKMVREASQVDSAAATALTGEGIAVGTVAYMSPEQVVGGEVTTATDVFALGVVLYELLANKPAFSGDSNVDTLYKILHHEPCPISELNPNVPAELQSIVARCTAKAPEDRYSSVRELHDELKTARINLDIQRTRTLNTLLSISKEMTSILELEPLLERLATLVKSLIDYDVLGIFRVEESKNRLVWLGGSGYVAERARQTEYSADRGLCGKAIHSREAIRIGDVSQDRDYYPPNGEAFRSNLVVPLIHQNRVVAVLNMESRHPHFFTTEHVTIMSTLAGLLAVAVANADLFEERQQHAAGMETLHKIGYEVSSILELDALLNRVGELTRNVIDYDMFAIFLLDEESGRFHWKVATGYDPEFIGERQLKLGQGIISRAIEQRAAVIVGDASEEPDYIVARTEDGRTSRSELAVPMIVHERPVGALILESVEPQRFRTEHADLMTVLASQVAVAIENARLYRELHDRAQARQQEADRIRRRFESYVTPHIAEQVFSDPQGKTLAGERRLVTVLVADILGFTPVSESLPAEDTVRFLQEFFSVSSHVIFKYEGTVDKFIGDAVMAFYGAPVAHDPRYGPSDAQRAVFAALDIRDAFRRLRTKWWERHEEFGTLGISIGINSGECLLGNMGSDKRVEYTAIGEAVNQAFRLCREAAEDEIRMGGDIQGSLHEDVRMEPVASDGGASDRRVHVVQGLKYI